MRPINVTMTDFSWEERLQENVSHNAPVLLHEKENPSDNQECHVILSIRNVNETTQGFRYQLTSSMTLSK